MRTKFQPPEHRPEARRKWRRFRVNAEEGEYVDNLAAEAGFGNTSDYLRALVSLQPLRPGAPLGNRNKAGKRGANQFSKGALPKKSL